MRSVVVVLPASMWAMIPMLRYRSSGYSRLDISVHLLRTFAVVWTGGRVRVAATAGSPATRTPWRASGTGAETAVFNVSGTRRAPHRPWCPAPTCDMPRDLHRWRRASEAACRGRRTVRPGCMLVHSDHHRALGRGP